MRTLTQNEVTEHLRSALIFFDESNVTPEDLFKGIMNFIVVNIVSFVRAYSRAGIGVEEATSSLTEDLKKQALITYAMNFQETSESQH